MCVDFRIKDILPFGIHVYHEEFEQRFRCRWADHASLNRVLNGLTKRHGREVGGHFDHASGPTVIIIHIPMSISVSRTEEP